MMLVMALMAVSALLITSASPSGMKARATQAGRLGITRAKSATEASPPGSVATQASPNSPISRMNGTTTSPPSRKPRCMS